MVDKIVLIKQMRNALDPLLFVAGDGEPPDESFEDDDTLAGYFTAAELREAFRAVKTYEKYTKNKKSQIGETKMLTTDELARWTRLVEDCKSGKLRSINVGGQGIRAIIVKVDILLRSASPSPQEPVERDEERLGAFWER